MGNTLQEMINEENSSEAQDPTNSSSPTIADIIAQRVAANQGQLAAAQDQSRKARLSAGITQAVGNGIAQMTGGKAPDYSFLQDNAQQPVKNVQALQAQPGLVMKDMSAQQGVQDTADANDPYSARGENVQQLLGAYNPKLGALPIAPVDAGLAAKLQDTKETADARLQAAHERAALMSALAGQKADAKSKAQDQKSDQDFDKQFLHYKPYTDADSHDHAADSVIAAIQEATTSPTAAALLPTKLGVFASEGGRLHGMTIEAAEKLNQSLKGRFETYIAKSQSGTLPPDQAQDAIKMVKLAQQEAKNTKQSIAGDMAERFNKTNGRYPRSYSPPSQAPAAPASPSPAGSHPQDGEAIKWASHPQDDEAIKWARANPQDKRSADILKRNGVQ